MRPRIATGLLLLSYICTGPAGAFFGGKWKDNLEDLKDGNKNKLQSLLDNKGFNDLKAKVEGKLNEAESLLDEKHSAWKNKLDNLKDKACSIRKDCDYAWNDLSGMPLEIDGDENDCGRKCMENSECHAFTFRAGFFRKKCYLKHTFSEPKTIKSIVEKIFCGTCDKTSHLKEHIEVCYSPEGHCYKAFSDRRTWYEAKEFCESIDMQLPVYHSQKEHEFINDRISTQLDLGTKPYRGLWIGYKLDRKTRKFRTINGEDQQKTFFSRNEPNDMGKKEDCVMLMHKQNLRWNDAECGRFKLSTICQSIDHGQDKEKTKTASSSDDKKGCGLQPVVVIFDKNARSKELQKI